MSIFYWTVDTTQFILQPQTTRWRSRYRGPRESWKQNLEMNQIAFDIYQLYQRTYNDELMYENNQFYIEFGTGEDYNDFGYSYDSDFDIFDSSVAPYDSISKGLLFTIVDVNNFDDGMFDSIFNYDSGASNTIGADIAGTQDIIRRIQSLQFRIKILEDNQIPSPVGNYGIGIWDDTNWDESDWL